MVSVSNASKHIWDWASFLSVPKSTYETGKWVPEFKARLCHLQLCDDGTITRLLGCQFLHLWKEGLILWLQSACASHTSQFSWVSKGWVERSMGGRLYCLSVLSTHHTDQVLSKCLVNRWKRERGKKDTKWMNHINEGSGIALGLMKVPLYFRIKTMRKRSPRACGGRRPRTGKLAWLPGRSMRYPCTLWKTIPGALAWREWQLPVSITFNTTVKLIGLQSTSSW